MEEYTNKENMPSGPYLTSSLRRKSCLVQNALPPILTENNDEAERLALRNEISASATLTTNVNTSEKRRSLGLSFLAKMSAPEIKQHISDCIKLNTENKINIRNAFGLEIIDFMTYMISKQDANMTNLQVASTSLDVSTKIYGFRVDNVHTEIMKMSGGLDRNEDGNPNNYTGVDVNNEDENQTNNLNKPGKKKRKKNEQKLFGTVNNLRGTIETSKPSFWIREDEDVQSSNALFQVILPNHANSNFYLHSYDDVIVDAVEHKVHDECMESIIPRIEDFSESEICPPLDNIKFHNWTDGEAEENQNVQTEEYNENKFQFDLDASLPSEDEVIHNDINHLDIQNEEENENRCKDLEKSGTKIVDLCKVVSNCDATKISEYSFLKKNMNTHWAGPSHWKVNNLRNFSGQSKIVGTCHQEPVKRRKEIELNYDDKAIEAIAPMFVLLRRKAKSEVAKINWQEEKLTLPRDMHCDIASCTKLYLHKLIDVNVENSDELNTTHVSDIIEDYNYDNENDTSNYCPYVPNGDYETCEDNVNGNECDFRTETQPETQAFTDDNLVAVPKLTNKISIAYSVQAKRIDMRQLKKSIWKSLTLRTDNPVTENADKQDAVAQEENKMNESKCFSKIYKTLPNMLTKANIEALSFPISFVSLLHLANEKTLKIQSLPDMSDIIVEST